MFDSEKRLSDEMSYVLMRRQRESIMGNQLDRPSLLMKNQFVRETETMDVDPAAGQVARSRQEGESEPNANNASRRRAAARAYADESVTMAVENSYKDYANFLSCAPLQLFNLRPDDNGIVEVSLKNLENYSQVYFIALDENSAT